tara:strand:+ start:976 stop:1161 length:186 start_codon:yes stop_codon:yes gene_type:complete
MDTFIQNWWPQLTALVILVAYLSRVNAAQNERINQLEKKVEQLFVLWNKHIDWLLNRKDDK